MLLENENFMNYEVERSFITSPYNKLSFYIPGKGITVDEDGNIKFYPVSDIDEFVYGQDIESEFLFDNYQLNPEESDAVNKLLSYNKILKEQNIAVVYMRSEKGHTFLFITDEEKPEVFYKISEADINKVTKAVLPEIQPNTITTAKYINI